MLDEKSFNHHLATYLRTLRRNWGADLHIVRAEALRVIKGKQPDIILAEPYLDPVILETEFEPASTVDADARTRLGASIDTGDIIYTVFAVKLPASWRDLPDDPEAVAQQLRQTPLAWAVWTLDAAGTFSRWPAQGWITTPTKVLAFALYRYSVASHRVQEAFQVLVETLEAASVRIKQLDSLGSSTAMTNIAAALLQSPGEQTWKMASLILINALVFHGLLAGRGNLSHVASLDQMRWRHHDYLPKNLVLAAWAEILEVDYWPIFDIASRVLDPIPDDEQNARAFPFLGRRPGGGQAGAPGRVQMVCCPWRWAYGILGRERLFVGGRCYAERIPVSSLS